jgi:hypothetical protein
MTAYASVDVPCNRTPSRAWRGTARVMVAARKLPAKAVSALLVYGMI